MAAPGKEEPNAPDDRRSLTRILGGPPSPIECVDLLLYSSILLLPRLADPNGSSPPNLKGEVFCLNESRLIWRFLQSHYYGDEGRKASKPPTASDLKSLLS